MKKILLTFILSLMTVLSINAQTAIETSKATDNMYVGVGAGVATPLDFNSVFPLNTGIKAVIGKNITPVVGVELEGLAMLNDNHFGDLKTAIKATNVGANATINLSNLFAGYNGKPRWFEFRTNTGIGWLHTFDAKGNFLTAKTALDIVWNIGNSRALTLVVSPGVYWNLNGVNGKIGNIKFNKNHAQLAVFATLTYNFKNKNGLRYFKKYDVGAMIDEIDRLNKELAEKLDTVTIVKTVDVVPTNTAAVVVAPVNPYTIFFAKGSADLTDEAKTTLDNIKPEFVYDIAGYASPEGTEKFNNELSLKRAQVVAEYLKNKNIKTGNVDGKGVAFGESTNRVVIVTAK